MIRARIKRRHVLKLVTTSLDDFVAYCRDKKIKYEIDYMQGNNLRSIDTDEMIAIISVYMTTKEIEKFADDLLAEGITNFSYSY